MSLYVPSWLTKQRASFMAGVESSASAAVPVRETAPGYRYLSMEVSAIDDSAYPKDPAVTAALRSVDTGKGTLIPLWVRWIFRSPSDRSDERTVVFGRHAIGRFIPDASTWKPPFYCLMPPNADFPVPNQLDRILEGAADPDHSDLPGAYTPWDYRLIYYPYVRMSVADLKKRYVLDVLEKRKKAEAGRRSEEDYVRRQFQPYWDRKLTLASDVDIQQFNQKRAFKRQERLRALRQKEP